MDTKDEQKDKEDSALGKLPALGYAFLLTLIFFTLDQLDLFGGSDLTPSESLVQGLMATFITPSPEDSKERAKGIPIVLLFSDKATELDKYGWPINMEEFLLLIEDIHSSKAKSLFVDFVIRSARHDEAGFCELIKGIAALDLRGKVDDRLKNLDKTCLKEGLAELVDIATNTKAYAITSLVEKKKKEKKETTIIFGAPLEYLRPRKAFYECKQSCTTQLDAFRKAIEKWPGVAYLDQVSILAPIGIATDQGKSARILVDKADFLSPAYIMAYIELSEDPRICGQNSNCPENLDRLFKERYDLEKPHYLIWRYGKYRHEQLDLINSKYGDCIYPENKWYKVNQLLQKNIFPEHAQSNKSIFRCPYYPTIDLVHYASGDISLKHLQNVVAGRSVILGTDMRRFNDHIQSPLHGQLPGAFSHATSLDNLANDWIFTPTNAKNSKGNSSQLLFLSFQYGIFLILVWVFLAYQPTIFKKIDAVSQALTYIFTFLMLSFSLYLMSLLLKHVVDWALLFAISCFYILNFFVIYRLLEKKDDARQVITYILTFLILSFSLYLVSIPLRHMGENWEQTLAVSCFYIFNLFIIYLVLEEKLAYLYPDNSNKCHSQNIRLRLKGWFMLAPHLTVILGLLILFACIGMLVSWLMRIAPPDVLSMFYYSLPLYMMAAREDISQGFAKLLGNRNIAETLLD